jgi:hypothetical protein
MVHSTESFKALVYFAVLVHFICIFILIPLSSIQVDNVHYRLNHFVVGKPVRSKW